MAEIASRDVAKSQDLVDATRHTSFLPPSGPSKVIVMSDVASPALRQLIARRRGNFMLDQAFYTDPEVFRADLDLIFSPTGFSSASGRISPSPAT
jgi:hypothetical protein